MTAEPMAMDGSDDSVRCGSCGTTAKECGRVFRLIEEWCCILCRQNGAGVMHGYKKKAE